MSDEAREPSGEQRANEAPAAEASPEARQDETARTNPSAAPEPEPTSRADGDRDGATQVGREREGGQESEGGAARAGSERDAANRAQVFDLYEQSLEGADWGYKIKTGPERDIGHKSVALAERAYISAGLYDKDRADKMWEESTGKPPKPELQQRLAEARGADPREGIADLTAGLGKIREQQQLWALTLDKNQIEKQMGNWEVAIGDARERRRNHTRARNDELLKPERPGQHDDSGLEMFVRACINGGKAGRDWRDAMAHGKKVRELGGIVRDSRSQHGDLVKQIAAFTQEQGERMGPTAGPVGRNAARFPGASKMAAGVADMGRKAADAALRTLVRGVEAVTGTRREGEQDQARQADAAGPMSATRRAAAEEMMRRGQGQGIDR